MSRMKYIFLLFFIIVNYIFDLNWLLLIKLQILTLINKNYNL